MGAMKGAGIIFGHVKTRRCRNRQSKWTVRRLSIYIYGQITDENVGPRRWGKHIYIYTHVSEWCEYV